MIIAMPVFRNTEINPENIEVVLQKGDETLNMLGINGGIDIIAVKEDNGNFAMYMRLIIGAIVFGLNRLTYVFTDRDLTDVREGGVILENEFDAQTVEEIISSLEPYFLLDSATVQGLYAALGALSTPFLNPEIKEDLIEDQRRSKVEAAALMDDAVKNATPEARFNMFMAAMVKMAEASEKEEARKNRQNKDRRFNPFEEYTGDETFTGPSHDGD